MSAGMDAAKAGELVHSLSPDEQYTLLRAVLAGGVTPYRLHRAIELELPAEKYDDLIRQFPSRCVEFDDEYIDD